MLAQALRERKERSLDEACLVKPDCNGVPVRKPRPLGGSSDDENSGEVSDDRPMLPGRHKAPNFRLPSLPGPAHAALQRQSSVDLDTRPGILALGLNKIRSDVAKLEQDRVVSVNQGQGILARALKELQRQPSRKSLGRNEDSLLRTLTPPGGISEEAIRLRAGLERIHPERPASAPKFQERKGMIELLLEKGSEAEIAKLGLNALIKSEEQKERRSRILSDTLSENAASDPVTGDIISDPKTMTKTSSGTRLHPRIRTMASAAQIDGPENTADVEKPKTAASSRTRLWTRGGEKTSPKKQQPKIKSAFSNDSPSNSDEEHKKVQPFE